MHDETHYGYYVRTPYLRASSARTRQSLMAIVLLIAVSAAAVAESAADAEASYERAFLERFSKADAAVPLEEYASAARYDALYLGDDLDAALSTVNNDQGGLAWGLSYRMMSLNGMYRATGDAKYLEANVRCIRASLGATDDKRGKALWTGRIVPAWGCDKYAQRGRAVFAVHTGIITAPIFDCLLLVKENAALSASLGAERDAIRDGARAALAVHDRQWRDGPEAEAGHYIGLDQEDVCENKPLPGNRISAMGWALWLSAKIDGDATHRARALAIGRYIKNRLTPTPEGDACFWPYWLPEAPVTDAAPRTAVSGEDTSHAGLTMALPLALGLDGHVFDHADMKRFANTVTQGFARREDGVLYGKITGTPDIGPEYVALPCRWIPLARYEPGVRPRILAFYLGYQKRPGPLDIADLLLWGRP